jgi:hypothetical protein
MAKETRAQRTESATGRVRRLPRRRVESFADWMARVDAEVEETARKIERRPPTYAWLHPAQRRIVQMLIEHLRSLPELHPDEDPHHRQEYCHTNQILTSLFLAKYPNWTQRTKSGLRDGEAIPNGEGEQFSWMLRNCAGRAPAETPRFENED